MQRITKTKQHPDLPTIKLMPLSYQPSREEPEHGSADQRADASLEQLAKAIARTVKVGCYKPKHDRQPHLCNGNRES